MTLIDSRSTTAIGMTTPRKPSCRWWGCPRRDPTDHPGSEKR